ncbi:hypothetical protein GOARA_057_00010 [Gordonia araii NBRC 100433]|uniref:Uncharacterized protein n=1 Tax=Gordonia araii NBRC 100433 TaxID=1073574 RepID=G7H3Q2_9ACTN|nr:hypothetical protein [Gordonia araii]GAB10477.1 hypothetical protein GOARA_057_00010 [Gordonia araii NBRC 100433]
MSDIAHPPRVLRNNFRRHYVWSGIASAGRDRRSARRQCAGAKNSLGSTGNSVAGGLGGLLAGGGIGALLSGDSVNTLVQVLSSGVGGGVGGGILAAIAGMVLKGKN